MLNGFIYSLLGLYDLNATIPTSMGKEARFLYDQGMISLKKMLVLFDTGSGTIYDLRHFTLGIFYYFFFYSTFTMFNFDFVLNI